MVSLVAPDYVEEYPQSGEVIRGRENLRAILENYPGGFDQGALEGPPRTFGPDERWVMTPTFTLTRLEGSGGVYTTVARVRYPDGSHWHVTAIREVRDGQIVRSTTFFGPQFDPPEWRRQWVEVRPDLDHTEPRTPAG
jgi:PAS domain-containing protein